MTQFNEHSTYWFRCEAVRYSYAIDADAEWYGVTAPRVEIRKVLVVKTTPKGAWLRLPGGDVRYVCAAWARRYAAPTEAEAVRDLRCRREAQIRKLEAQIARAKEDLAAVERYVK